MIGLGSDKNRLELAREALLNFRFLRLMIFEVFIKGKCRVSFNLLLQKEVCRFLERQYHHYQHNQHQHLAMWSNWEEDKKVSSTAQEKGGRVNCQGESDLLSDKFLFEILYFQLCFFFIADSYFEYHSTAIQKKMVLRISSDDIIKLRGTIVPCKFYAETEYKSRQVEGGGIQIFRPNPCQNHCQNINPTSGRCWDHLRFYSLCSLVLLIRWIFCFHEQDIK